jgi:phosphoglycolate phosphatase
VQSAVLFDLDGTLVDSAADIARALSTLRLTRGGCALGASDVRPLVSLGAEVLLQRALGSLASNAVDDLAAFRTVLGALTADPLALYPGVVSALKTLTAEGHVLAIVTNKPEALSRNLLTQLGLVDHFAVIIGGDTAAKSKPHPDPLRMALETIGIPSERAIFVGDSPIDAAAARACAIPFILFEGGYGARECAEDAVYARFNEFATLPAIITALATHQNFVVAGRKPTS